jgi:hypothetical protein
MMMVVEPADVPADDVKKRDPTTKEQTDTAETMQATRGSIPEESSWLSHDLQR